MGWELSEKKLNVEMELLPIQYIAEDRIVGKVSNRHMTFAYW